MKAGDRPDRHMMVAEETFDQEDTQELLDLRAIRDAAMAVVSSSKRWLDTKYGEIAALRELVKRREKRERT